MSLTEQIYAQALVLAQDLADNDRPMLELLCRSAEVQLGQKLREGMTPEDCKADFVASASLYALAALTDMENSNRPEQFTAGDITLRRPSNNVGANCLRYQAEMIMQPYVKDSFSFMGV